MDYKSIFLKNLQEDLGTQPVEPQNPQPPSDGDVWNQNNPGIVKDDKLNGQFNVAGLPVNMMENYSEKINQWRQDAEQMTIKLEEIYKFAAKNADRPGLGEIFSSIGSLVEGVMTDLGTLNGQLRSLGEKIKVMMAREDKKKGGID